MSWPARPTSRCLVEDLTSDWGDVAAARSARGDSTLDVRGHLHDLDHPLVRHARDVFTGGEDDDLHRESISGLTDPPFWKIKTSRWRGAAFIDADTGQTWVVAAGLREAGSQDDFYKRFMREVKADLGRFLPTLEDRKRLKLEHLEVALSNWEQDLHARAREWLLSGAQDLAFDVAHPVTGSTIATVELTSERTESDETGLIEVTVVLKTVDWECVPEIERAELVLLCGISPREQEWTPSYLSDGSRIVSSIHALSDIQAAAADSGRRPGESTPGEVAHYAHRQMLVEQTIEGRATKALCGKWFVPRQDYEGMGQCPTCSAIYGQLQA